ncbi:MAG: AI-2E family transporter [Fimbriimonas sp.]
MGWRIALWLALLLGALAFLFLVRGVLLPFILAFLIAALLEPTVGSLAKRGVPRPVSVLGVMGAFFTIVLLVVIFFAPAVTRQVGNLTGRLEELVTTLTREDPNDNFFLRWDPAVQVEAEAKASTVDTFLATYADQLDRFGLPTTQRGLIDQYVEPQRPQIAKSVRALVDSMFGAARGLASQVALLVPVPIIVFLILSDVDGIKRRLLALVPPSLQKGTKAITTDIGQVFFSYLRGISTVVMVFILAQSLVFMAFGVPYGILLGLLTGVLYLIPMIGNILSSVILFFVIGLSGVSGNNFFTLPSPWLFAALIMVVFFLISQVFDQILTPRIVGDAVGLHPVGSMFVVFCGGALFGLPGMVLAFPLAGSIKVIVDRLLRVTSSSPETIGLPAVPLRHRSG